MEDCFGILIDNENANTSNKFLIMLAIRFIGQYSRLSSGER
jgi:hypothetical protein